MATKSKGLFRKRKNAGDIILDIITYLILGFFALLCLFLLYCMIITAISPDSNFLATSTEKGSLFPTKISFESFTKIFTPEFFRYLMNTLIVCIVNVLGVVFAASFTAFGLSKVPIKGKKFLFGIILGSVLLPGVATSIPLAIIYRMLGWGDNLLPLILPVWFGGGAMNIFLIRQFMKGIPNSLTEAAILDGASYFTIYWKIILPLIKPVLLYLAVMTFIGRWNDFQGPLVYLSNNPQSWTLSLALYKTFYYNKDLYPNTQMAAGLLMMIPTVFLFARFQKQLTEGVSTIGVKG